MYNLQLCYFTKKKLTSSSGTNDSLVVGRWITNLVIRDSRRLGSSMVEWTFHPSTTDLQEKKTYSLKKLTALRIVNFIHKRITY